MNAVKVVTAPAGQIEFHCKHCGRATGVKAAVIQGLAIARPVMVGRRIIIQLEASAEYWKRVIVFTRSGITLPKVS